MKRGAYFFVIDAFIAASILAATFLIIFTLFIQAPSNKQSFTYAHDYLSFLTTTEARDFHHQDIQTLISNGDIDGKRTLAQNVLLLNDVGKKENVSAILGAVAENLPASLALNVTLQKPGMLTKEHLYSRNGTVQPTTHLVARTIIYAVKSQDEILGPELLEVEVWS